MQVAAEASSLFLASLDLAAPEGAQRVSQSGREDCGASGNRIDEQRLMCCSYSGVPANAGRVPITLPFPKALTAS